jgi:hypothetical protein
LNCAQVVRRTFTMDNIRVAARVRPFNERERNEKASVRWEVNEKDNTMSEKRACVSSSMATYVFGKSTVRIYAYGQFKLQICFISCQARKSSLCLIKSMGEYKLQKYPFKCSYM